jgi:hypothetical protein
MILKIPHLRLILYGCLLIKLFFVTLGSRRTVPLQAHPHVFIDTILPHPPSC